MQKLSSSRTGIALAVAILISLFGASVAIADIISDSFATASSSNATITNVAVAKPSGVAEGDLMLASIALHDGGSTAVTPPAGWTLVLRTDNDSLVGIATYQKLAGSSEPANYTWQLSPQTRAQGSITRYSGVDAANPIDIAAGLTGRSKIATTSSIVTTEANAEIVSVYALHVGTSTYAGNFFSVPAGMTEKFDVSYTSAGPTIASFDAVQVAAGDTGSKASTISGNPNQQRDWASQIIALRPYVLASPAIVSFTDDTGTVGDGITSDTTPTFAGSAPANSTVSIFDGATQIGTATANSSGVWEFTATLTIGAHSITAIAAIGAYTSVPSPVFLITIEDIATPVVSITSFSNDSGLLGDGITNDNTVSLIGTAPANSTVKIFDGSTQIGSTTTNSSGTWSYTTSVLSNGIHILTAAAFDASGQIGATSNGLTVRVDTVAPTAPVTSSVLIVNTNQVQIAGTAEANSKVTVYDGTTVVGIGTANSTGVSSVTTNALSTGTHALTAKASDAAGNVGTASQVISVTI